MKNELEHIEKFIEEVNKSNSTVDKTSTIEKYKNNEIIKKVLLYTNDYQKQYNVTSKNILKRKDLIENVKPQLSIFDLLDSLNNREITGHKAISSVNGFIDNNSAYRDLILNIIDKDLKIRCGISIINKAIPDLIPEFNVALANRYDAKRVNLDKEEWFVSRKLDGCRCIVIVDGRGKASAWSRQGNQFETLDVLLKEIEGLNLKNVVFDGEICIMENGIENFQGVMKEIRKKEHTIVNPCYKVFDYIPLSDFNKCEGSKDNILSNRLDTCKQIVKGKKLECLEILDQIKLTEQSFADMQKKVKDNKWEGLIIRKNTKYEGKRSNDMLKVKSFFDGEYVVKNIELRIIPIMESNGKFVETEVVGGLEIEHKGCLVTVGSGLSQEQRIAWKKDPKEIIGKTITVAYFEETKNERGGLSLRFPTLKVVHGSSRDT